MRKAGLALALIAFFSGAALAQTYGSGQSQITSPSQMSLNGTFQSGGLPAASTYKGYTVYTADQGPMYSNGTAWVGMGGGALTPIAAYSMLMNPTASPAVPVAVGSPVLYAVAYGVVADGLTSNDAAMKAAADACNLIGGHLLLPPGHILLDGTGGTHIELAGCWMQGTGGQSTYITSKQGTTFDITSTTVVPFYGETQFKVSDVSFYYPNQTDGVTVYPTTFNDGGSIPKAMRHCVWDNITVINAYDFITITPGMGTGDCKVMNSTFYAAHYLFNLHGVGDTWNIINNRFTPGPWLGLCNFCSQGNIAVNAAALQNAIFHATAGNSMSVLVDGANGFAWRYGVLVDSGGSVSLSTFNWFFDSVGTVVDTSPGGIWYGNVLMTGSWTTCGVPQYDTGGGGGSITIVGNGPCFNFGSASGQGIHLVGFQFDSSQGSFIESTGNNFAAWLDGMQIGELGKSDSGAPYYLIHATGTSPRLKVYNSKFTGLAGGTVDNHCCHGITLSGDPLTGDFIFKNNTFNSMTDIMTFSTAQLPVIQGNSSFNTYTSGYTLNITGTGKAIYTGNYWDTDPIAMIPPLSTDTSTPSTYSNWGVPIGIGPSGFFPDATGTYVIGQHPLSSSTASFSATSGSVTVTMASTATISGVAISGTAGQFTCTCTNFVVGMNLTLSGTYGGTGSITGYVDPTTYYVSATNGTSTFTLKTLAQVAIVTTAGTPTGITYTPGTLLGTSADVGRVLTMLDTTYKQCTITAASTSTVATCTLGATLSGTGPFANAVTYLSGSPGNIANTTPFSVPFPAAFPAAYLSFNANAICASGTGPCASGSAAAIYYATCSLSTVCQIYTNTLTVGAPEPITAPTAWSGGNSPGAFTQGLGVKTLITITVKTKVMGDQGALVYEANVIRPTTPNSATFTVSYGGTNTSVTNVPSVQWYGVHRTIRNVGVATAQVVMNNASVTASSDETTLDAAPTYLAINSAAPQSLLFKAQLSVATDYMMLVGGTVTARYGATSLGVN